MKHHESTSDIRVSIVIPMYNAQQHLAQTLDTVVHQSHSNLEIFIVDDGSTDSSRQIAEKYAASDTRVRVICQKNSGAAVARNQGIQIASGKYILFLDADDLFNKEMVAQLLCKAESAQADITICNFETVSSATGKTLDLVGFNMKRIARFVNPNGCCLRTDSPKNALQLVGAVAPWNKLFRLDFIRKHKLSFLPLSSSNDLTFVLSACLLADKISFIDLKLIKYIVWDNSISHKRTRDMNNTPASYYALMQFMKEHNIWDELEQTFTISAAYSMGWNLLTGFAPPEKIREHAAYWATTLPLKKSLLADIADANTCAYLAVFYPEYTLILPEIKETHLAPLQALINADNSPQLPVQVLYGTPGAAIDSRIPSYPVALPFDAPDDGSASTAISYGKSFAQSEHILYPGCDTAGLRKALRRHQICYCFARLAGFIGTAKKAKRVLRRRINNYKQLLEIMAIP